MVDPQSTNKTIDTGQNDDGITISNQNNEGQQQQRINLVENLTKNPNNGQDASQSELAGNGSDEMKSKMKLMKEIAIVKIQQTSKDEG